MSAARQPADPTWAAILPGALAFATAELVVVFFHECCHAIAARALGFFPSVYAFYENNPSGTPFQDIVIAAAGPLGSFVSGILIFVLARRQRGYSYVHLLVFWLGVLGVTEFINYLIVTPWLTGGDTGLIAERLGLPVYARYLVSLAGWLLLGLFGAAVARAALHIAPSGVALSAPYERKRYLRRMLLLPYLLGLVLYAPAAIGTKPFFVLLGFLGTAGTAGVLQSAVFAANRARETDRPKAAPPKVEPPAVVAYLGCVVFYVTVLAHGLPI